MYLGLDLGTSSVKAIIMNEQGDVVASHSIPLTLSRPHPQWSEQDPQAWWQATDEAIKQLSRTQPMEQISVVKCMARYYLMRSKIYYALLFYGTMVAVLNSVYDWQSSTLNLKKLRAI